MRFPSTTTFSSTSCGILALEVGTQGMGSKRVGHGELSPLWSDQNRKQHSTTRVHMHRRLLGLACVASIEMHWHRCLVLGYKNYEANLQLLKSQKLAFAAIHLYLYFLTRTTEPVRQDSASNNSQLRCGFTGSVVYIKVQQSLSRGSAQASQLIGHLPVSSPGTTDGG